MKDNLKMNNKAERIQQLQADLKMQLDLVLVPSDNDLLTEQTINFINNTNLSKHDFQQFQDLIFNNYIEVLNSLQKDNEDLLGQLK